MKLKYFSQKPSQKTFQNTVAVNMVTKMLIVQQCTILMSQQLLFFTSEKSITIMNDGRLLHITQVTIFYAI